MIGILVDVRLTNAVINRLKVLQGYIFESYQDENGNTFGSRDLHRSKFNGHQNILGAYYRQLFQTVKFVVDQSDDFLGYNKKREYLRTLRAQLSDFEQLMLYYNALVDFGQEWLNREYFTKYRMIHNMPIPLADFGVTPDELLADALMTENPKDPIFEWS